LGEGANMFDRDGAIHNVIDDRLATRLTGNR
jgi:hypothetical protein